MKRSILIMSAFLVVFAGVAAAWASCKEISIASDDHRRPVPAHAHDHHSHSDHHHSDSAIHCPPIDDYLPTATFTISPDQRVERLPETLVGELDSGFIDHALYRLIHGPPGSAQSRIIPQYLFFSVLRI